MQSSNSFNNNLVFFVVVGVVLCVCTGQAVFAAGRIISWGSMSVNSSGLDCNDFVSIAAGQYHSLALRQDGSIVGWGCNGSGRATPPVGSDFVAIAAGGFHCLALKQDGSIVGWGGNHYGQATPPAGNDYVAIAAGGYHSLALKQDGSIVGWGWDDYGQATPPAGNDYVAIAAGWEHCLALRQDGSIVGWGYNDYGQATPPLGNDYVAIAAERSHSLALKQDGSIVGWGRDNYGQATPPVGSDYVAIAAGYEHSLALKSDGSIVAWGYNGSGRATPPVGSDFVSIAAGEYHCLALKQDGSIIGWGRNNFGQTTLLAGNDYVAIAAGGFRCLALKQDGSIIGWGDNYYGQATPPDGSDFVAIAAGRSHSLALKQDNSIVGWGRENYIQATFPVGSDYVAIAAGYEHSLALKSDGTIVGWGRDNYGQATPTAGSDYVAIAAGRYHSLALKQDGSIIGWGWDNYGQATPPAGNDYVAIAAGWEHCLALRQDGSIIGWGDNDYGQATPPDGSDFVAIAAGRSHSLALKQDGSIVGWGYNNDGQATPPVGGGFVAIAAGGDYSLAIKYIPFYVSAASGDNDNDGLSPETAFATIQKGIDSASNGNTVLVYPGVYAEEINFLGKAVTVRSVEDAAVIENPDHFGVSFYNGEGPDSILKNFVIRNSFMAVFIASSSPTISNVTIVDNKYGIEVYAGAEPDISNSIFWGNIYSDMFGCEARYSCTAEPGEGNIDVDPLFADPNNGDYHLLSERGRYWPERDWWILDEVTSPCIDGGDPAADYSSEPIPDGGRVNMGAYGGTAYASMKEMRWRAGDINHDGWVNMTDFVLFAENWLTYEPPTSNWPPMVSIIEPQDGAKFNQYEIPIWAGAVDVDGWVEIVEFFANGTEIGEDDDGSNGWQTVWTDPPGGTYSIGAKAMDDDGAVATSLPIEIYVEGKGRFCFTDDTGVWVDGELVGFSEVMPGQRVAGFGGACVASCSKEVECIEEHEGVFFECYDIVLESGNLISVVGSHLFLADSGQWVPVEDLRAGTKLRSMNGAVGIGSIARRPLPYIGKVYNLKVKDGNRYLVGKDGIIVRDY